MPREKRSSGRHWLALIIVAYAVFLVGLPGRPVPTIDGAVRASLARNIVETGQWFPLTYQGRVFIDHPPLFVWTIAASFKFFDKIFGNTLTGASPYTDFATNFPMHFCAFLTVIMTYLVARQARLSRGVALMAALILCATRDFVLSSVRGYIEPLLEVCIYGGLYFTLRQFRSKSIVPSILAAIAVAFAWFAKGPPALWPTLYFPFLLLWNPHKPFAKRIPDFAAYALSIFAFTLGAYAVIKQPGVWPYFDEYLHKQVLSSALQARNNAQTYDPFYFFNIMRQYYWPWLPFLLFAFWRSVVPAPRDALTSLNPPLPTWIFTVFGLGFFAGFSIVKWKFWYYIAPAYPAFSLAITSAVFVKLAGWLERPFFPRFITSLGFCWILIVSCFPISLFRDRVPEVTAFAPTIRNSPIPGPVWYLHNPMDHNLIATSGEWSFGAREVKQVTDEGSWSASLAQPAWIVTGADFWNHREQNCRFSWCQKGRLIQTAGKSVLVLF